jgi:hypothetical protein
MTTFAAFVTAISELTITGVNRSEDSTPESMGAADLPFQFVRLPEGESAAAPIDCRETGETKSIDLVVCIKPAGLETAEQNFDDTVAMMDYIRTALIAWDAATAQLGLVVEYSIATSGDVGISVGGVDYWGVIATITITG